MSNTKGKWLWYPGKPVEIAKENCNRNTQESQYNTKDSQAQYQEQPQSK